MPKGTEHDRFDIPELAAPRRVFKRKRNKGGILALKIALPLIAAGCVGYIVYWSREAPRVSVTDVVVPKDATQPQSSTDFKVKEVQYNGVDANNRPFSITAASASQPQASDSAPSLSQSVVNLQKLQADMTLGDGAWVAVKSDSGVYHRDEGRVDLSGNVELFHDTGLFFETDAATVDLKNDMASGDRPIEGQNPDGQLTAQGFEVRDGGQTIVFTGRAYMKLYPKKGSGS